MFMAYVVRAANGTLSPRLKRFTEWSFLATLGKYSYAIYLFHQPLNQMIGVPLLHAVEPDRVGTAAGLAYIAVVTAASYVLALASYHGYEKHFLALKRYFPSVTPGAART